MTDNNLIQTKVDSLIDILEGCGKVLVCFSGGVDSSLLMVAAKKALGNNLLAATAVSETLTKKEVQRAKELALMYGVEHLIIKTNELEYRPFIENTAERCYHCKYLRLSKLKEVAAGKGMVLIEGSNADDAFAYRPGMKAVQHFKVLSPLREVNLTKKEVRHIAKLWGIPTWNEPSQSCLATRIPYGEKITLERLQLINRAEDFLEKLGFTNVRVRHHRDIARIEVAPSQLHELVSKGKYISLQLKKMGFTYVTADLDGFNSGSMDRKLTRTEDGL
ncbi:ATP-dependent sacrificial sulfur transferase LarE [Desulfofalx alkaliphila]|uniref:ATP-dependent sacrificial sulfur transferase LarE n=1 Tax=Desulfofalx alkaliphila TaxID=105483 RepID=UPI0004E217E1|nr:ATP-dependent sacrificial sulfur transferase LarE [Desulfofalx alkaliphila]